MVILFWEGCRTWLVKVAPQGLASECCSSVCFWEAAKMRPAVSGFLTFLAVVDGLLGNERPVNPVSLKQHEKNNWYREGVGTLGSGASGRKCHCMCLLEDTLP